MERLSWYADDRGRKLRLFFENRASTSYGALQNYMQWIQNDPDCTIRRDCIVSYQPVEATRKLAQVADFYASATAAALEPDQYGMPTEDYLMRVKHQLYREPGKSIQSYGFKVFPNIDPARYPCGRQLVGSARFRPAPVCLLIVAVCCGWMSRSSA